MKGNVLKLLLTAFTHIHSSIDSKSIDGTSRIPCILVLLMATSQISTFQKFQSSSNACVLQSFSLRISALKKGYQNSIKLNAKEHLFPIMKKKQAHKTNSIQYSLQKKSLLSFFYLDRFSNMSQLDYNDLITMNYIESILCLAHVVYSYTGLRKTNRVLCFQVDHSKRRVNRFLILIISLCTHLGDWLFQWFIFLGFFYQPEDFVKVMIAHK